VRIGVRVFFEFFSNNLDTPVVLCAVLLLGEPVTKINLPGNRLKTPAFFVAEFAIPLPIAVIPLEHLGRRFFSLSAAQTKYSGAQGER
jgi:hypothetical protein